MHYPAAMPCHRDRIQTFNERFMLTALNLKKYYLLNLKKKTTTRQTLLKIKFSLFPHVLIQQLDISQWFVGM